MAAVAETKSVAIRSQNSKCCEVSGFEYNISARSVVVKVLHCIDGEPVAIAVLKTKLKTNSKQTCLSMCMLLCDPDARCWTGSVCRPE